MEGTFRNEPDIEPHVDNPLTPGRVEDIPRSEISRRKPTELMSDGEKLARKLEIERIRLSTRENRLDRLKAKLAAIADPTLPEAKTLIKEIKSAAEDVLVTQSIIDQTTNQIGNSQTEVAIRTTVLAIPKPRVHGDDESAPTSELLHSALLTLEIRERRLANVTKQRERLKGNTTDPEYLELTREIKDLKESQIPDAIQKIKDLEQRFDAESESNHVTTNPT